MSDELTKLRESIKRSKKVIEAGKALKDGEVIPTVETVQTETGERSQSEGYPQSE